MSYGKWEYLAIQFVDEYGIEWIDSTGQTGKLDGYDWQKGHVNLVELLNRLGAEGWELITHNSRGSVWGTLIFKRRKI